MDGSGGALQSRKDKQVANLSSKVLLNIPLYVLVNDMTSSHVKRTQRVLKNEENLILSVR